MRKFDKINPGSERLNYCRYLVENGKLSVDASRVLNASYTNKVVKDKAEALFQKARYSELNGYIHGLSLEEAFYQPNEEEEQ